MAGNTAARVGSINVLLQTQIGGAINGLNTFAGAVDKTGARVAGTVAGIDRSVGSLNRTMASISPRGMTSLTLSALRAKSGLDQLRGLALATTAAVAGLVPAGFGAGFVMAADRAKLMENNLRTVTTSTNDLKDVQEALFQVAQRSRAGMEGTVTLYARTARATEHLGLSQEKLLKITETVQKAFSTGSATTAEAQGGAIQLAQGIASDRLSGDEFRSVMENAPVLARAMATALGVTLGKLREMAHAGELTADVVTKAILDANAEIEASYAKTSSTIGQAVQMIDNELLKFVANSSQASAAASAIVGVLNIIGDNIENIATILALLAVRWGAAFSARQVSSVTASAAAWRTHRVETLAAAQSAKSLAQAQHLATQQTLASTRAAYEMAKANTVSASTRARLGKELQAAARAELLARAAAQQTAVAYTTAAAAAGRYGMALGALRATGSAVLSFLGGPLGIALLAAGAAFYLVQRQTQAAQERTERYADAVKMAGENSAYASYGIRKTAEELERVAAAATTADRTVRLMTAQEDLADSITQMQATIAQLGTEMDGWSTIGMQAELQALVVKFGAGEISAEEFIRKIDEIGGADPDTAGIIAKIQSIAETAAAAMGVIDALNASLAGLGGMAAPKSDRVPRILPDDEFNARFGGRYAEPWKDIFPDLYKKEKGQKAPKKTADDRFDSSVQAIYDRIEALRLEREMLSATYFEQVKREEALKLEQEALKQAREEARQKGEVDWQSAQISAAKRAEIDKVTTALAQEATATKYAKESTEAWNEAANGAGGLLRQLSEGSLTAKDALLQLIPVILKLMNSLNVAGGGKGIFGGGILQSLIGGFFGIGWDQGGYTGAGGKYEPAGVVHRGEYVFNKEATDRIGADNLEALHQAATNGYADGGYVREAVRSVGQSASRMSGDKPELDVRVAMDRNANLQAYVERTSGAVSAKVVQAAAPGIVDASTTATRKASQNRPGFFR